MTRTFLRTGAMAVLLMVLTTGDPLFARATVPLLPPNSAVNPFPFALPASCLITTQTQMTPTGHAVSVSGATCPAHAVGLPTPFGAGAQSHSVGEVGETAPAVLPVRQSVNLPCSYNQGWLSQTSEPIGSGNFAASYVPGGSGVPVVMNTYFTCNLSGGCVSLFRGAQDANLTWIKLTLYYPVMAWINGFSCFHF